MILVINDRLPSLNEYTKACRSNRFMGANMKKNAEKLIGFYITNSELKPINNAFIAHFTWHNTDKRRDPDNIAFAKKFILDALQKYKIIKNDSFDVVKGFIDTFVYEKQNKVIVEFLRGDFK